MPRAALAPFAFAAVLAAFAAPAIAVESCDLNGEHVNPNNGNTTAGKTGLMRCRDGDGGRVVREQELKGGVFMGVVRYFGQDGGLEREYSVNERGNRHGLSREYERGATTGAKPALVREQTYRNGSSVGIARTWFAGGTPERVGFYGDDGRELASAEFTKDGKLYELGCGPRPLLAPYADDARWCGHAGGAPEVVVLYNGKGEPKAKLVYERGARRKSDFLTAGVVREQREWSDSGGVERAFYETGTKRREVQWVLLGGDRDRRVTTLEQEFHESGKLVHEKRWTASDRGEPVSEQHWFLNGQPRDRTDYASVAGRTLRTETRFHDNGRKSSEGAWRAPASGGHGESLATGTHKSWDSDGKLRAETVYDERGRLTRERDLDASGKVVRDDEVFEDGSRKAFGT